VKNQFKLKTKFNIFIAQTTTMPTATTNTINQYLHSFRETNYEKELATLPLPDRFVMRFKLRCELCKI